MREPVSPVVACGIILRIEADHFDDNYSALRSQASRALIRACSSSLGKADGLSGCPLADLCSHVVGAYNSRVMAPRIRICERAENGELSREISVTRDEFVIGRGADCDLRLADDDVSRHHCSIHS